MYRELYVTVKQEAQMIESVFPSSQQAMELFLQRQKRRVSNLDGFWMAE